jgi:hypothetical protein
MILHPRFRVFFRGFVERTLVLGRAGIVLENKRLKMGCIFQSIGSFGIVFGGV